MLNFSFTTEQEDFRVMLNALASKIISNHATEELKKVRVPYIVIGEK